MKNILKVAIQGYPGSFHDAVAQEYWPDRALEIVPADTFEILGDLVASGRVDVAIMAIENSIAGTIIQNYRILRERHLWVSGERYLKIAHNLLALPGTTIDEVKSCASHPMAIAQCLPYLRQYPDWKIVESEDTALSAVDVRDKGKKSRTCIASVRAAQLYNLDILAADIHSNDTNYTRFFVVESSKQPIHSAANKASIYIRIPDQKGQLLKVLQVIEDHDLNMSKLQSYPVLGSLREYFFHLDIEFDHLEQYFGLKEDLATLTMEYQELGIYAAHDIQSILSKNTNNEHPSLT
jgi:prephenate dehydratase